MAVRSDHPPAACRPVAAAWTLLATPSSIPAVRELAGQWLHDAGASRAAVLDGVLAMSELVTNAIQASDPRAFICVRVACTESGWRIEVANLGPTFDPSAEARWSDVLAVGGRGFEVVRRVAGPLSVRSDAEGWTVVSTVLPFGRRPRETIT